MKCIAAICVALLVINLIYLVGISERLAAISAEPKIATMPVYQATPAFPSAKAIAEKIKSLEEPPVFTFQQYKSNYGNSSNHPANRLQYISFTMTRSNGSSIQLNLKSPPGVIGQIKQTETTDDYDKYEVSFMSEHNPRLGYLPDSWQFSIEPTDNNQTNRGYNFEATFHPENDKNTQGDKMVTVSQLPE